MKVNLKPQKVKAVVKAMVELAAKQLTEVGKFTILGIMNMKLKKKPARNRYIYHGPNVVTKIKEAQPAKTKMLLCPVAKFKKSVMT